MKVMKHTKLPILNLIFLFKQVKMKKNFFKCCFASAILFITVWSCKKNVAVVPDFGIDPEMDFSLRLLNDKGEETKVFKQGETLWLSFLIINKLNENRFFMPEQLVQNKQFFRIVRTDDNVDLGRPYEDIFCTSWKVVIAGKQNVELRMPWRTDTPVVNGDFCVQSVKKDVLSKGNYKTVFQDSLSIGTMDNIRFTRLLNLASNFEIQ